MAHHLIRHQRLERLQYELNRLERRRLADRANPLEAYTPDEIHARFRLSHQSILFVLTLIGRELTAPTIRNNPLPPLLQFLAFLRYAATGKNFFCYIAIS